MSSITRVTLVLIAAALWGSSGCSGGSDTPTVAGAPAAPNASPAGGLAPSTTLPEVVVSHPEVVLQTSFGNVKLKLNYDQAPRTVQNFLNYVASGHYNGTIFHHVESGYVLLGGNYTAELNERPGRYPVPNEAGNGAKNRRGTIAMARQLDGIDSSACQFFINLADNDNLDHHGDTPETYGFCVFGEVVEGLDVLERIAAVPTESKPGFDRLPTQTVLLESVRRVR